MSAEAAIGAVSLAGGVGLTMGRAPWLRRYVTRYVRDPAYLEDHPAIAVIALTSFLAGIVLLTAPSIEGSSALAQVYPRIVETLWLVAFSTSGFGVLWGIATRNPAIEAAALMGLAWCGFVDMYAIVDHRGTESALVNAWIGGVAFGCLARSLVLRRRFPAEDKGHRGKK
jgi:hypothetical protein